ncbi:MAG: SurA N-terminal domain-containing protein [Pseudomonadota bacterium]
MLDFFRRGVKTWVAKALLGVLILSFAVWGIGAEIFSFNFSTAVSRVGDTKISAEEFARALQREQDRQSRNAGELVTLDTLRRQGIDQQVLAALQRDAAFTEELSNYGVRVPDEAAVEAISLRPEFQNPDGSFSPENVRFYLSRQGITEAEFLDLNRALVGQSLVSGPAIGATRPPPGMATRIATYQGETRLVASVTLPLEMASEPEAPSDGDLRDFYDQNPALYTEPERRSGNYLHVNLGALVEQSQPSDEEVTAFYEAEAEAFAVVPSRVIDQLSMPDLAAAEAAVARIRAGEITFEDLATERGEDPAALSLGRVTRDDVPAATADAIFAVTEPGVVDPVTLPVGVAIVRISEVEIGGQQALADVRDDIAGRLALDTAYTRAPELANQIEEMRAGGASMAEIAEATGLPLGRFERLGADASLPGGERAEGVLVTPTFRSEVFEALEGEERPIIDTPEGGFLLISLDRIEPGGLQNFAEVRDRIAADWTTNRKLEELEVRGGKMAASLAGQGTLDATARALDLVYTTHEPFSRESGQFVLPAPAVELAFATLTGEGFSTRLPDDSGVMVGEVLEITPIDPVIAEQTVVQLDQLIEQTIRADAREYLARAIASGHEVGEDPAAIDEVFIFLGSAHSGGGF